MKIRSLVVLLLIFSIFLVSFPHINEVKAQNSTIYIRVDGIVEGTDKIRKDGNVYTLVDDLSCSIDIMDVFITIEKDNIVFDGDQKIIQGTGNGIGIEARGRTNVTIQNVRIIDFGIGIEVRSKDPERNTTGSNNHFLNNYIESKYFSLDLNINNGTVSGNTLISKTNKYGIILNGNNTVFSNNKFVSSGLIVYKTLVGNIFFNNSINGKPLVYLQNQSNQVIDEAGQVILMSCNNITIKNVSTTAQLRVIINLFGTNDTKITNCKGNIVLTNCHNNIIVNNQLEDQATMVSYDSACVKLSSSNNNTIKGNSIVATGSRGVSLTGSSYNNVQGNQISSTGEAGVKIELTSLFNYIKENSVICLEDGIYISGAQNTFVLNNVITDCKNGVELFGSPKNSLVANNISRCTQYAIYLAISDNNTFYHNNFVNNQVTFYEEHDFIYPFPSTYYSKGNRWDNDEEGNYWSDYTGTDIDGDGIGDNPYFVYENKTDNYPLMIPFNIETIPEFSLWIFFPILISSTSVIMILKSKLRKRQ